MDLLEMQADFLGAVQDGDFDRVASYLADDFMFSGPTPQPVGAEAWVASLIAYRTAFPDIDYGFISEGVEGNKAWASNELSGTHTGDLDLSFAGINMVVPATGNSFRLARQHGEATWDGDQVVSVVIDATPEGSMPALLAQLGVEMPGMG